MDPITEAVFTIHNRRMRGEYREGNIYISALPPDLRYDARVVIESAYLFFVQGKFGRAMKALESYCLPASTPESEIVVGCLTLMHGYAIMQCRCKLSTAWEEAVKIREALLKPGLGFTIDPEDTVRGIPENLDAMRIGDREADDDGSKFSPHMVWFSPPATGSAALIKSRRSFWYSGIIG